MNAPRLHDVAAAEVQLGDDAVVLHSVLGHHHAQVFLQTKQEAEVHKAIYDLGQKDKVPAAKKKIEFRFV